MRIMVTPCLIARAEFTAAMATPALMITDATLTRAKVI